jgi:hypothetical protein
LSPDELAFFDLLLKTQMAATQAGVKMLILDDLYRTLPRPSFTDDEADKVAESV